MVNHDIATVREFIFCTWPQIRMEKLFLKLIKKKLINLDKFSPLNYHKNWIPRFCPPLIFEKKSSPLTCIILHVLAELWISFYFMAPFFAKKGSCPAKTDVVWHKINVKSNSHSDVLHNRCSSKFSNIHIKTPVLESLFNKVLDMVSLRAATSKETPTQVLSCQYCKTFKNNNSGVPLWMADFDMCLSIMEKQPLDVFYKKRCS